MKKIFYTTYKRLKLYLWLFVASKIFKKNIFDEKYPQYLNYCEVLIYVRSLKLQTKKQFEEYAKQGLLPKVIPVNPNKIYKDRGWWGYDDLIGTNPKDDRCKYLSTPL